MKTLKVRLLGPLVLLAALLAVTGCPKIKPTPYQLGLEAYYSALLSGKTEQNLLEAVTKLNEQLKKSPSDPGVLALRASSYLELLRLKVQGERTFHAEYAENLFRDLQLLQTLADQTSSKLWLKPRLSTMAADAFLLRAEAMPVQKEPKSQLTQAAQQGALYQLAADFYQHAWTAAQVTPTGDHADTEATGLEKEKANARDGYTNALSGAAKTKRVLGFAAQARMLTKQVIDLVTTPPATPPAPSAVPTPGSLYAYSHATLKSLYESMETSTIGNYPERVGFAEAVLREDLAARLLASTPDFSFTNEPISTRLLSYYAAGTARARQLEATGGGDLNKEMVSFDMVPGQQYVAANVNASVEYVSLKIGPAIVHVDLGNANVPPDGVTIMIHSKAGQSQDLVRFLNRSTPLFATGAEVQVLGPGGNVVGTVAAQ
jgi:hypothetical protein